MKHYQKPEVEIIGLEAEGVILSSSGIKPDEPKKFGTESIFSGGDLN